MMSEPAHRTIFLIRHAKADDRMQWGRDDRERPLTKKGQRQALILAEMLAAEPIGRIMSSPAVRCAQTVEPLGAKLAITVDIQEELFEGNRISLPEDEGTYVICAHGDNIPDLLTRLNIDYDLCQKASAWKVEIDDCGEVIAAQYAGPPGC